MYNMTVSYGYIYNIQICYYVIQMINGDYDHHLAQVQHDEQKLQTRNSGPTVY